MFENAEVCSERWSVFQTENRSRRHIVRHFSADEFADILERNAGRSYLRTRQYGDEPLLVDLELAAFCIGLRRLDTTALNDINYTYSMANALLVVDATLYVVHFFDGAVATWIDSFDDWISEKRVAEVFGCDVRDVKRVTCEFRIAGPRYAHVDLHPYRLQYEQGTVYAARDYLHYWGTRLSRYWNRYPVSLFSC